MKIKRTMRWATAHNTANNDAPSFDKNCSCGSIAFGARELVVYGAKSNGVVCRDLTRHGALQSTGNQSGFQLGWMG
jgi:hypothetical protein